MCCNPHFPRASSVGSRLCFGDAWHNSASRCRVFDLFGHVCSFAFISYVGMVTERFHPCFHQCSDVGWDRPRWHHIKPLLTRNHCKRYRGGHAILALVFDHLFMLNLRLRLSSRTALVMQKFYVPFCCARFLVIDGDCFIQPCSKVLPQMGPFAYGAPCDANSPRTGPEPCCVVSVIGWPGWKSSVTPYGHIEARIEFDDAYSSHYVACSSFLRLGWHLCC